MIEIPTVFVLGAGASKPYGYPTGEELRDDICRAFSQDIERLLKKANVPGDEVEDLIFRSIGFMNMFRKSRKQSIDQWLLHNPKYLDVGKLAIANSIIRVETESSKLFFEGKPKEKEYDWFTLVFNEMTSDKTGYFSLEHFMLNQLSFVTFNYDRVLEHLLCESLTNTFSESAKEEIDHQLSSIHIFHVYGCVDEPPWRRVKAAKYGGHYTFEFLKHAKSRLNIINEERSGNHLIRYMQPLLSGAKRVFFLGFGFDPVNLERLKIPEIMRNAAEIYVTGYGLSEFQRQKIQSLFSRSTPPARRTILVPDAHCAQLLRDYL